jgi:hypothetical protein
MPHPSWSPRWSVSDEARARAPRPVGQGSARRARARGSVMLRSDPPRDGVCHRADRKAQLPGHPALRRLRASRLRQLRRRRDRRFRDTRERGERRLPRPRRLHLREEQGEPEARDDRTRRPVGGDEARDDRPRRAVGRCRRRNLDDPVHDAVAVRPRGSSRAARPARPVPGGPATARRGPHLLRRLVLVPVRGGAHPSGPASIRRSSRGSSGPTRSGSSSRAEGHEAVSVEAMVFRRCYASGQKISTARSHAAWARTAGQSERPATRRSPQPKPQAVATAASRSDPDVRVAAP